jgi:DnaJ-class molecular chaperone
VSVTVSVVCPDCNGTGDGAHGFCPFCLAQGHVHIDREADGAVPLTHPDGRAVVEWIPPTLPPTPTNPLVTLYERCIP